MPGDAGRALGDALEADTADGGQVAGNERKDAGGDEGDDAGGEDEGKRQPGDFQLLHLLHRADEALECLLAAQGFRDAPIPIDDVRGG
jgi:hypothetical protein